MLMINNKQNLNKVCKLTKIMKFQSVVIQNLFVLYFLWLFNLFVNI